MDNKQKIALLIIVAVTSMLAVMTGSLVWAGIFVGVLAVLGIKGLFWLGTYLKRRYSPRRKNSRV